MALKILTPKNWGGGQNRYCVELRVTDIFHVYVRANSVEGALKQIKQKLEEKTDLPDQEHVERIVDTGSAWNADLTEEAGKDKGTTH